MNNFKQKAMDAFKDGPNKHVGPRGHVKGIGLKGREASEHVAMNEARIIHKEKRFPFKGRMVTLQELRKLKK